MNILYQKLSVIDRTIFATDDLSERTKITIKVKPIVNILNHITSHFQIRKYCLDKGDDNCSRFQLSFEQRPNQ